MSCSHLLDSACFTEEGGGVCRRLLLSVSYRRNKTKCFVFQNIHDYSWVFFFHAFLSPWGCVHTDRDKWSLWRLLCLVWTQPSRLEHENIWKPCPHFLTRPLIVHGSCCCQAQKRLDGFRDFDLSHWVQHLFPWSQRCSFFVAPDTCRICKFHSLDFSF